MSSIGKFMLAGMLTALGGCATLTDSSQQQLELHAIQDHREIDGVGCVLTNAAGRWFVVAPGRVTIERSAGALAVDCKKEGRGSAQELIASRFDTGKLIGNLVVTAGLGYLVDRHSGAGFSYPATLAVVMQPATPPQAPDNEGRIATPMF